MPLKTYCIHDPITTPNDAGPGAAKCFKRHGILYLQTTAYNTLKESDLLWQVETIPVTNDQRSCWGTSTTVRMQFPNIWPQGWDALQNQKGVQENLISKSNKILISLEINFLL